MEEIKKIKEFQKRFTLDDCINAQNTLRSVLLELIEEDRTLADKERNGYFKLIPKALISQGTDEPLTFVLNKGWFTFESLQTFAIRLGLMKSNHIKLETTLPDKICICVNIRTLWQILFNKLLYYYPKATSEATHISAEQIKQTEQKATEFTSKEKR